MVQYVICLKPNETKYKLLDNIQNVEKVLHVRQPGGTELHVWEKRVGCLCQSVLENEFNFSLCFIFYHIKMNAVLASALYAI